MDCTKDVVCINADNSDEIYGPVIINMFTS